MNSGQGSFGGPAPGFSGPSSPASAAPQRFVSRAAAQYEHSNVYTPSSASSGTGNTGNSRFSPYEETSAAGNNVSQYYTNRTALLNPQLVDTLFIAAAIRSILPVIMLPVARTTSTPLPAPHHQQPSTAQQQSGSSGHYSLQPSSKLLE